jgi:hypothetical protein
MLRYFVGSKEDQWQMAKGIENGDSGYMGGLNSMVHWLHLFGPGPAGQELRRRLAKVACPSFFSPVLIPISLPWSDCYLGTQD